jgi:hypothetical protein
MHILIPSTQCLLCSSSVTSLLAMVTMSIIEQAAHALLPPPPSLEPPPHLQVAGLDYCSLLLLDLKIDCPKDDIRAIFESTGTDFGGQGAS